MVPAIAKVVIYSLKMYAGGIDVDGVANIQKTFLHVHKKSDDTVSEDPFEFTTRALLEPHHSSSSRKQQ